MTEAVSRLHRKLKMAGWAIMLGLIVSLATVYWSTPLSFLFFIVIGGLLVALGILSFLLAIITP
jgi:hypothetical protein